MKTHTAQEVENFSQLTVNRIHKSAAGPAASATIIAILEFCTAKQMYLKGAKTASDS